MNGLSYHLQEMTLRGGRNWVGLLAGPQGLRRATRRAPAGFGVGGTSRG